jgi:hypothetical protein
MSEPTEGVQPAMFSGDYYVGYEDGYKEGYRTTEATLLAKYLQGKHEGWVAGLEAAKAHLAAL